MSSIKTLLSVLNVLGNGQPWDISTVLELFLVFLEEDSQTVNNKVNLLLRSHFEAAKLKIELACLYPDGSDLQISELSKAKEYFELAAQQLQGVEKAEAFCLAAFCCAVLNQNTARNFYYIHAIQTLNTVIIQLNSSINRRSTESAVAGGLFMAGIGAVLASIASMATGVPYHIPPTTYNHASRAANYMNEKTTLAIMTEIKELTIFRDTIEKNKSVFTPPSMNVKKCHHCGYHNWPNALLCACCKIQL